MTSFNESPLVGYLRNVDYPVKIPIHEGINIINSDYFREFEKFSNLKSRQLVLFKLHILSQKQASLRTFEGLKVTIQVTEDDRRERVVVNTNSVKLINSLDNFEIGVANSFNNFGTFRFRQYNKEVKQPEKNPEKVSAINDLDVIDLRSESSTGGGGVNSALEGDEKEYSNARSRTNSNSENPQNNIKYDVQNYLSFNLEDIQLPNFSHSQSDKPSEDSQVKFHAKNNTQDQPITQVEQEKTYFSKNFEDSPDIFEEKTAELTETNQNSLFPSIEFSSDHNNIFIPKIILGKFYDEFKEILKKNSEIRDYGKKIVVKRKREEMGEKEGKNNKNISTSSNTVENPNLKSNTCTICLETINLPSKVTGCDHIFCKECIDQWAEVSNTCPLCKKDFKKIIYYNDQNKIINQRNVKKKKFKYEDEENDAWMDNCLEHCMKCKQTNDVYLMLVCDKCKFNVCHTYCAGLDIIPDDDWFCSECEPNDKPIRGIKTIQKLGRKNKNESTPLADNKKFKKRKVCTEENRKSNTGNDLVPSISTRSLTRLAIINSNSKRNFRTQKQKKNI